MSLFAILQECGLAEVKHERVYGGDINQAYRLYDNNKSYFLKVNDANRYPNMFTREADGLDLLRENVELIVPAVIKNGVVHHQQYLLLEWLEDGRAATGFFEKFGTALAQMHRHSQSEFGLATDNYIGSLPQSNLLNVHWHEFYAEQRILPLVQTLVNAGPFSSSDDKAAQTLCKKFEGMFPKESPSLLHGDLWSGNYKVIANGLPAIFDPAVYYGHREMDIGMTLLFGGFDPQFYHAYQESYPLEKDWRKRTELTQLYPILVHSVLFGGHYIAKARDIIKRFG